MALLDPETGRLLEEYWHPGGLFRCKIHDLDKDGEPEVLLGGVNNPGEGLGHAALVVLSLPFSKAGRRPIEESAQFWNPTSVKEMGYVLSLGRTLTTRLGMSRLKKSFRSALVVILIPIFDPNGVA